MNKGVASIFLVLIIAVVAIVSVVAVVFVLMQGQGNPYGSFSPESDYNYPFDTSGYTQPSEWQGETGDTYPEVSGETGTSETTKPSYKTSDKLTTITFTREVDVPYNKQTGAGRITQSASFKITGYLKEIDPDSSGVIGVRDRVFDFDQGKVEWSLDETSNKPDILCTLIDVIGSSGKDSISNLNIEYSVNGGKDDSGNYIHLPSWGNLRLVYAQNGLKSGGRELYMFGQILIPIDVTTTVQVNKPNAICGGARETTTVTSKDTANVQFPMVLTNFDIGQASHTGEVTVREPVENEWWGTIISGYQNFKLEGMVLVAGPITILGTDGPWQVSWDIKLP